MSCRSILKKLLFQGAITQDEYDKLDRNLKTETQNCRNIAKDYCDEDQFVCSECGVELQDWVRVERDEDDGEITYHEYLFRFCPNCGRKVVCDEYSD